MAMFLTPNFSLELIFKGIVLFFDGKGFVKIVGLG